MDSELSIRLPALALLGGIVSGFIIVAAAAAMWPEHEAPGVALSKIPAPPPAPAPRAIPVPAPHGSADAEACPDFTALCDMQITAMGCTLPTSFPDDAGAYGASSVRTVVDEALSSCGSFADHFQQLDCSEYPCLLFVRPPAGVHDPTLPFSERGGRLSSWGTDVSCGFFGGADGLALANQDELHRTDAAAPEALGAPGASSHEITSWVYAVQPTVGAPEVQRRFYDRVTQQADAVPGDTGVP